MQAHTDADMSMKFYSLDKAYFIRYDISYDYIAIANHTPRSDTELDIQIGDRIGITGNLLNGYYNGFNRRTKKTGSFPSNLVTYRVLGNKL